MADNRMPTTMTFDEGLGLFPLLVAVGNAETGGLRLEPNELYCKDSVHTYEWIPGDHVSTGHFRALPRSGGKMSDYIEATDG